MEKILYAKYSNERNPAFAIRTDIHLRGDGAREVGKRACFPEGEAHVKNLEKWYHALSAQLQHTPFSMNVCTWENGRANLEYLAGQTLEEQLDDLLLKGEEEAAVSLLLSYAGQVRDALSGAAFSKTPEFRAVFGDAPLAGAFASAPVTDLDMVPANVIVQGERWVLIDYEWTFDFPIPADFVIYRAIKYYLYGNQIRASLQARDLYDMAGIGRENLRAFDEMEEHFQAYLRAGVPVLEKLYEDISPGYIPLGTDAEKRAHAHGANQRFEVFLDRGEGFSARDSYDILYEGERAVSLSVASRGNVRAIRLDPPVDDCIIWVKRAIWDAGGRRQTPKIAANGATLAPGLFAFAQEDAQIVFRGIGGDGTLSVDLLFEPGDGQGVLSQYAAARPKKQPSLSRRAARIGRKGLAYFRRNGVRKTVARGVAKLRGQAVVDYQAWLQSQRPTDQEIAALREEARPYFSRIEVGRLEEFSEILPDRYYLFLSQRAELEKGAKEQYAKAISEHPGAEIFYCDSDFRADEGEVPRPWMKPDFDDVLLPCMDYIGAGFLMAGSLVLQVWDDVRDLASARLYGLLLFGSARAKEVVHVPKVLCHETGEDGDRLAKKRAVEAFLQKQGVAASVLDGDFPGVRRIRYRQKEDALVSVMIPNCDHVADLSRCLKSIQTYGGYDNLEILILENNSKDAETAAYYEKIKQAAPGRVRVIPWEGAFDFAKINNFGARAAKGDYLLFLNNDTEMKADGCVRALLNYGMQDDVGAVGAHMDFPDGTLQHAGIIVGYGGVAGHAFEGFDEARQRQVPWIWAARQYSAVTAACMLVKKETFLALGGFCAELGVAYNDVDLCLRIRESGKKVVYTPDARLTHRESQTRGYETTGEKARRVRRETAYFCARWGDRIRAGDPCYNPNLTLEKPDFSIRRGTIRKVSFYRNIMV